MFIARTANGATRAACVASQSVISVAARALRPALRNIPTKRSSLGVMAPSSYPNGVEKTSTADRANYISVALSPSKHEA